VINLFKLTGAIIPGGGGIIPGGAIPGYYNAKEIINSIRVNNLQI